MTTTKLTSALTLSALALFATASLSGCDLDTQSESAAMFRSGGPEFDAAADFDPSTQGIGGWHYLYDASGAGTYASLTVGSTYWGFQAWRDATCTEASVRAGTGELLVVPPSVGTCDGWTTLAWEAPSAGSIDFAVSVEEVDACGSGVAFELRDAAGNLLYDVADTAWGVTYEHADSMDVDAGERLYLRVGQGPGGSWCDTTAVSFQVDHSVETNLIIDPTYDNDNNDHSDWFDTGITVTAGRQLDITATGLANTVPNPDTKHDADGTDATPPINVLAVGLRLGSLVGKIGNGDPFFVGTSFSMPAGASGTLYLGFNDSRCDDNIGQFDVTVTH